MSPTGSISRVTTVLATERIDGFLSLVKAEEDKSPLLEAHLSAEEGDLLGEMMENSFAKMKGHMPMGARDECIDHVLASPDDCCFKRHLTSILWEILLEADPLMNTIALKLVRNERNDRSRT